ncbi:MAG TPA: TolC family protein [Terriglobia bacterium]|nr:TolC family protein [Terriglobia bacterium]
MTRQFRFILHFPFVTHYSSLVTFLKLATSRWPLATALLLVTCHLSLVTALKAQTFPTPDYFDQFTHQAPAPAQVRGPEGLHDYVVDGKLRLTLHDAVRLALLNNTEVRVNQLQIENAKYGVLGAYAPFDPQFLTNYSSNRSSSPATSQLQGASTVSTLSQQSTSTYSQTFQTGTNLNLQFSGSKGDTNSSFQFINPYLSAGLNLQFTQPLLRNRGLFPNRAPIVIAQRNLAQSRDNFEAQVSATLQQAIDQYWQVVLARESLRVAQSSFEQAQKSYEHDKRALELGALPPLNIYQSESQMAQRRVVVIQQEYALKQAEDAFRPLVGADLDPYVSVLDLDLVEDPDPKGDLLTVDAKTALNQALQHRPELRALEQQLENDDTSLRLAHNSLLPDLELTGLYASNGIGGNQLSTATPPTVIPGGFSNALDQLWGFNYPTYGFTLSLNLPIRNRSAAARLGQASVQKRSDLYQLRRQNQSIGLDVVTAVHQLEQAKLSLEAAKISRGLAQKNLEAEQRKYELGSEPAQFVLQAQTDLATAESGLVQAEVGYQMAVAAVDHATGDLLDHQHVQISSLTN